MFDRDKLNKRREEELKKAQEFNRLRKEAEFEKGDLAAIIIAALTTILPAAILVIGGIWFLTLLIMGFFR